MQKASIDVNLNTLMYLKKRYQFATKLTRKQWARRRHVHNWLAHNNVLKDWAKSYRFHRNSTKLIYYQFFTKNSFIAFNLVSARSSIPSLNKGSADIITGSYVKRYLRFFSFYSHPRFKFFSSFQSTRLLTISLNPSVQSHEIGNFFESQTSVVPLYLDNLTSLMPWTSLTDSSMQKQKALFQLFRTILSLQLAYILKLYKVLVLLTLRRLN